MANILKDIIGGRILINEKLIKQWKLFIYLFAILISYIYINLGMEETKLEYNKNQRELKNLKADYNNATIKLQYLSKREQVELTLKNLGSQLQKPLHPVQIIKKN